MRLPTLQEEENLWKKGYKFAAGLDEAGRGPLAGPVVAGAVVMIGGPDFRKHPAGLPTIKDSKQLSAKQREKFYKTLTAHPDILWGVGIVSEKVIDKINILEATKLAMKKAISDLKRRCSGYPDIDFLILDGKMEIDLPVPQKSIIKADEKVFSCAAASIIAKVTRDRIMRKYHKKYPEYHFDIHKGYGTELHRALLCKYGPCPIHRKSFRYGVQAAPPRTARY